MIRQFTLTLSILIISVISLSAQEFQEISCGAGYKYQSYVQLAAGTEKQVNNDAWDIAFTAFGTSDAGIFINESSEGTSGENIPQTELYDTKTDDFGAPIDVNAIKNNIYYNSEASWNYGAFNENRDLKNPFDFGWGVYSPQGHTVTGNKVYVLRLRSGQFKKIKILSFVGSTYTFKYADLNGDNEVTRTIDKKTDNYGQKLVFYSFTTDSTVDILPQGGYDLMYGRYVSWAKDPNGSVEQYYNVTGILTGPGIQTAIAKGVNPETVLETEYADKYSQRMDVIGYDWKSFLGTGWSIVQDRAHFLKMPDKTIWKVVLIDFEGSATGNAVIQKTKLGTSAITEIQGVEAGIFPNPVNDKLYISLDVQDVIIPTLQAVVTDIHGKNIESIQLNTTNGLNVFEVNTNAYKAGTYILRITNGRQAIVHKFVRL